MPKGIAVDNEHPLYANRCALAVELAVTSQAINRDRSVAPRSLAMRSDNVVDVFPAYGIILARCLSAKTLIGGLVCVFHMLRSVTSIVHT